MSGAPGSGGAPGQGAPGAGPGGDLLAAVRAALAGQDAWLVGGAVRDRLLGRDAGRPDLDVALAGDPRRAAAAVAEATGGARFPLSEAFGAWRVVAPGGQVDLVPLQGGTLDSDLAARDLTVNAMAEPLGGGELVDPHGGRADLGARRLRALGGAAFDADPLRVVRVARFATELGFVPDDVTLRDARARAPRLTEVAAERTWGELRRLVAAPAAVAGWELLVALGAEAVLLPELHALHGLQQSVFHHRDVHGHTLEVLGWAIDLQAAPGEVVGDPALDAPLRALLAEPLADELDRGGALRWAALLHDVAKPQTARDLGAGRIGFPGHDALGAGVAREVLGRLRTSERLRAHVAHLTRQHLRLGFLVHEAPLTRGAEHAYLVATEPTPADATLLTVCDRLGTRGRNAEAAIAAHLDLARHVLRLALGPWPEHRARPPLVRGDALARALGIAPGPALRPLLHAVDEARWAGEVATEDDAVALARRLGGT